MTRPIVWTIAGTDPGGGAGIQGDLKTMNALGVHGCSVITALIAQNTLGVRRCEFVAAEMIEAQLAALDEDLPPVAIKIGMVGTGAAARTIARHLRDRSVFVVYDPVMRASSGDSLLESAGIELVRGELLPCVNLITPNIPEAEALLGRRIENDADVESAGRGLLALGVKSALIKGGHAKGDYCQDYWTDGSRGWWLTSPRQQTTSTHGTGCTLSSAIASCVALGLGVAEAVVVAKAYVNQGMRRAGALGRGAGPLAHEGWPDTADDLPWMTSGAAAGRERPRFPGCGPEPLGLYPLVARAAELERLLGLGVRTAQLRAKDLSGAALEGEIAQAVELGKRFGARVFINDEWRLAIRHGAYGVHLGQEDLETADIAALASSGIRLGLSVRSNAELARAKALRTSYTALGAVFATDSKRIDYTPLGIEGFRKLCALAEGPVVAIGGIALEDAPRLRRAGAEGIAVISDLAQAPDLEARVRAWQQAFSLPR